MTPPDNITFPAWAAPSPPGNTFRWMPANPTAPSSSWIEADGATFSLLRLPVIEVKKFR
ncbi:hypothetical protein [Microtetraspora malaysiensis]|uniref:hypothetical protein n=1 Tax=Microtetraspora malaysiensis TaxID=161358 RepID=UPI000A40CE75|nr:hypothetical protein [Microtetraspora malaysiensis]